ncbi:hypothetical protein [Leptospira borgpetersenii]|uniref:Uncharacterized protein n=1 Tax=Leptospira borgpetersenii serovar Hardjo-bovis str. Sponselee TaxID=1303729 RepID=M6C2D2_LEPBO|nr:hypothetical protein [Leptospira borgpetersenii]EMJ84901.1 hypothetical protein LEP1GSC016_2281 [Leptospira borgpetersenii serovar Hardjo-bovis str. Sponselee]MBE8351375.1 hypothetical protein [Leptospira borgpetersenii serovar Hardjo-bovis]MBE8361817.1 hypothetical protein [Leptospira borgpetersenii serovar Hardjo-bovis]MBE8364825.1 hypothetical protein [Leptospira borgpetersenii serovar Balcanica]MBE8368040.1 hypothetical protein [Leptospira borgpetersenii serovar Balcanica]
MKVQEMRTRAYRNVGIPTDYVALNYLCGFKTSLCGKLSGMDAHETG